MGKWRRVLIGVALACACALPGNALAADAQSGSAPGELLQGGMPAEVQQRADTLGVAQVGGSEGAAPAENALIAQAISAIEAQAQAQDVGDAVPDSMKGISLLELYRADRLELPAALSEQGAAPAKAAYEGLKFDAKPAQYASGRIELADELDFGMHTVGRVSVDGLADRGIVATVKVYLDDDADPIAEVRLPSQQGKAGWSAQGLRTQDALAASVSGTHRVSLGLEVYKASDPASAKKAEVLLRSVEFSASSLPVLYFDLDETQGSIDAMNGSSDHSRECYGTMRVQTPAGYTCEYTGETAAAATDETYELSYIRGRGNSTWMADKKPYKVKLDKKADLFGMGANKHWVLLANRYDNSLMRNKMTYWMGERLGLEYTPQCVFVEVVMNGDYLGSYYLCEQVRVGSSRVDIDDLDEEPQAIAEPDVTGGYLLSMEYGEDEGGMHSFRTKGGYFFWLESPGFEEAAVEAQYRYIKDFVQLVEDAANAADFRAKGKHFKSYLDVKSAIDYYWIQMLSMNGDAYGSGSTYLYKKRDAFGVPGSGKLYWGPLWDFDYVAWGDLEYGEPSVEGFDTDRAPWLDRLMLDGEFRMAFVDRWLALKGLMNEATRDGGMLDRWHAELAASRFYDTERWGTYADGGWWSYDEPAQSQDDGQARSYADEVDQLRNWVERRVEWVDSNLGLLKLEPCQVVFKSRGKVVATVSAVQGRSIGKMPSDPKRKGYVFTGWEYEGPTDSWTVDANTIAEGARMVVEATWAKASEVVNVQKLCLAMKSATGYAGDWFSMDYEVVPAEATVQQVSWSSSNPQVAAVDQYGGVQLLKKGTAKITGTCAGGVKASFTMKVVDYDDEAAYEVSMAVALDKDKLTIPLGESRKLTPTLSPEPCITQSVYWISLDPETAYVGPAGVVYGNKRGTTYAIAYLDGQMDSMALCKVTVGPSRLKVAKVKARAFTGKQVKPKVAVSFAGKKLKRGRDFSLQYERNVAVGTARVWVSLVGDYSGSATAKFKIVPKKPAIRAAKAATNGKSVTVAWKKAKGKAAKQVSGYEVRWAKVKSMKGAKVKVVKGAGKAKVKLGRSAAAKARYVQVRAYKVVKGKKYRSAWSKRLVVK